jgi:hypothetical protein
MARSLGRRVVAEGVETAAQLEVPNRHGCEVAQAFFFSRPLPADECRTLLEDLAARPSFTDTLRLRLRDRFASMVAPRCSAEKGAETLLGELGLNFRSGGEGDSTLYPQLSE